MYESRLKSSLLTSTQAAKPSVLSTSSTLGSSSLLSSNSSSSSLLLTATPVSSSLLTQKPLLLNQTLASSPNERKKKADQSVPDSETKKPKILAEPKPEQLLLSKPALVSGLLNKTNLTGVHLVSSAVPKISLSFKSDLLTKPLTLSTASSILAHKKDESIKKDSSLKRQHSDNDTIRVDFGQEFLEISVPQSVISSIEAQIGPLAGGPARPKRLKAAQSVPIDASAVALQQQKSELIAAKNNLINAVSASLIREPNFKSAQDTTRQTILELAARVALEDPAFVLKLALYTRRELNIRVTANFLVCLGAFRDECRPYLSRFFKHSVMLPSDWIDVAEQYQLFIDKRINFGALPSALRKCMVDKFPDFDQYQLAKYNKEKSRLGKNSKLKDVKHMKSRLKEGDEDGGHADKKLVEDKYIKTLSKGLAIKDRIFIELVVKEGCPSVKIDILYREVKSSTTISRGRVTRGRPAPRQLPDKNQETLDTVAVRFNLDYEKNRIVLKSFLAKEWTKRGDIVNRPRGFEFERSFDPVRFFVDVKASEFELGAIRDGKELVLARYAHSKHSIPLFKLNCVRTSGVGLKLKDLSVSSQEIIHLDSQPDESQLRQRSYTLKQLIRQLHISQPVENVMSLIGKKYPSSFEEFVSMKLPGLWDSSRAGKRMKLPTPETWETQISLQGNKASVWEQLIDNKKLPYMAMLRNLRNMIKCGISERHHQWVLKKLQDEGAVIHSKQFPFRFFTAYSVLDELEQEFSEYMTWCGTPEAAAATAAASARGRPRAKKVERKSKTTYKDMNYDLEILKRYRTALDNALKVATTFNVSPIKGSTLILLNLNPTMGNKCDPSRIARGLGKRVTSVGEIAALLALMFKYSCEYSKLVVYTGALTYVNFQLDESSILDNMRSLVTLKNMTPEKSEYSNYPRLVLADILDRKEIFDNMVLLSDGIGDVPFQQDFLRKYRALVNDQLLFVNVNLATDDCRVVRNADFDHPNDICIAGFSDAILRFVAERGNQAQLTYVENIEKVYEIVTPKTANNKSSGGKQEVSLSSLSLVERPRLRPLVAVPEWRTLKVFVSSTFRDMHSERDLFAKTVFPLLRSQLAKFSINIYDIDLRWGIAESDAQETLDRCLRLVLESDYFLCLLGERYGQVVTDYSSVRARPGLAWLPSYPPGASITELEIETKLRRDDETPAQKLKSAFFFTRKHESFINDVPEDIKRAHFEDESPESRIKLERLKARLRASPFELMDGYPCRWFKLDSAGRALVTGLEALAVRVFNNLFNSISQDYADRANILELDETAHSSGLTDLYVKSAAEGFVGRDSALQTWQKLVEETRHVATFEWTSEAVRRQAAEKNSLVHMVLLVGEAGCGKTAFICHYLTERAAPEETFVHCVGAYPFSEFTAVFLKRASVQLNRRFGLGLDETSLLASNDYDSASKTFAVVMAKLDSVLAERKFYIVVDGVDQLVDERTGQIDNSFGWLPEKISPKVVFVFTARATSPTKSVLARIAASNKAVNPIRVSQFELENFDVLDRSVFVRAQLAKFDKYLDENPFNNQMKLLTGKRESADPLYLTLACEELRLHGHFETLSSKIRELPVKVNKLIEFVLDRLAVDFGDSFCHAFFASLVCSRDGLAEHELKELLGLHAALRKTWPLAQSIESSSSIRELNRDALKKLVAASKSTPTDKFLAFVESVSTTFLKPRVGSTANLVAIKKNLLVENALVARFGNQSQSQEGRASFKLTHRVMAMYHWSRLDAEFGHNWVRTSSRSFTHLPFHLVMAGWLDDAMEVVSDLKFLYCKCESGLASELADDFDLHESFKSKILANSEKNTRGGRKIGSGLSGGGGAKSNTGVESRFFAYKSFVMSNYHVLVSSPRLLFQQAMNEPDASVVAADLRELLRTSPDVSGCNLFEWVNKPNCPAPTVSFNLAPTRITEFDDAVSCVVMSWDGSLVACGTENCEIKLFSVATAKFLRKMSGHAGRVNSLVFIDGGKTLCSVSSDGLACVWNVDEGFRIRVLNRHNDHVVSDCCAEGGKSLVTVGWDCTAKIWNAQEGTVVGDLKHPRPINCITFSPDSSQIVTGCWDSCIRIFSFFDRVRRAVLRGHKSSIRSISFSHNGVYLASSAMDGEVKLWNSRHGAQVASLRAHTLPVNSVRFSPKNQFLVTGSSDRTVKIWPGSVGRLLRSIDPLEPQKHDPVTSVAFEQLNGHLFAAGTHSGELRVYEVYGGALKFKLRAHRATIRRVKFSPCSQYLLTASEDGLVKIVHISASSLDPIAQLAASNSPNPVTALDINRQNVIVAGSEDCSIYIYSSVLEQHTEAATSSWSELKARPQQCLGTHKSPVTAVSFNQTGDRFATAAKDATVIVWEYSFGSESARELFSINRAHADWITDVAWSSTSEFLLTASNDLTLKIWSGEKASESAEKCKMVGHTGTVNACAFRYGCAVSASLDRTLKIWSHRGHEVTTLHGHQGKVTSCDLFVKIRRNLELSVESKSDGKDEEPMDLGSLWADRVEMDAINEKKKTVEAGRNAFDIEDVFLVSGSDDGSVRVWKPVESSHLASVENHNGRVNSIDLSRADILASASSDRTVSLTNLGEFFAHYEKQINAERLVRAHHSEVTCLSASSALNVLISASMDGMVYLWKMSPAASGLSFVLDFKAHDERVNSVCVLSEGTRSLRFATCCNHDAIKVWEMCERADERPSIELVQKLERKSSGKNVFIDKCRIGAQDYLVSVEALQDRLVIKFIGNLSEKIKPLGTTVLVGEPSLLSRISLIGARLYVALVRDEVIEVDLAECFKRNTVVSKESPKESDYLVLRRLKSEKKAGVKKSVCEETWFTAVGKSGTSLFAGDWQGNVFESGPDGRLKWVKKINEARTSEIGSCRLEATGEERLVSCDQEGVIKIWTEKFESQLGTFKNSIEISKMLLLNDKSSGNIVVVVGDKSGNVNLLKWFE